VLPSLHAVPAPARSARHLAASDHDEAARWSAIYARYRKAFTDRKTLIALGLWSP
jgi:hypothetical protein